MDKTKNRVRSAPAHKAAKEIVVQMITLDEFVNERSLSRLDFQGCELAALEGARHSFLKFAPRFAICFYHKLEDIWTIPHFIKDLEKDGLRYELYFAQHTLGPFGKMILYGTPVK